MPSQPGFRQAIADYVRQNAQPPDKYSHQARLYHLACRIADGQPYDDDLVYAAAWLHDLGVFVGHRPADVEALKKWDHLGYACQRVPGLLHAFGFPPEKVDAVVDIIRTHLPGSSPASFEGLLIHDADILEQLGSVGILRAVSKVGRDTRFILFSDALRVLRRNLEELPALLRLAPAVALSRERVAVLRAFLDACDRDSCGAEW